MKRILNILVAVVTCICVLTTTTVQAFATEKYNFVNEQGFKYYLDENGYPVFEGPIELYETTYSKDLVNLFSFVDGTSALDIAYTVEQQLPQLTLVAGSGAAAAGSAAGGGTLASGAAAVIAGLTTGQIVLLATLVSIGIVYLTEPELVENTVLGIWELLSGETQAELEELYSENNWTIDSKAAEAITNALTNYMFTSDGVYWQDSLIISTDDFSGYTDAFASTPVIEQNTAENLSLNAYELKYDEWLTIDSNQSIYYRLFAQGEISNSGISTGTKKVCLAVFNTVTGTYLEFYVHNTSHTEGRATYNPDEYKYYISEPRFIIDGDKTGIEFVVGWQKLSDGLFTFVGQNSMQRSIVKEAPIKMTGTGSTIEGSRIGDIGYNSNTGLWEYSYKPWNNGSASYSTIEYPLEPYFWIMSPSRPATPDEIAGAIKIPSETISTDEYGAIVTLPAQPVVSPISIPKPEVITTTETDPITGEVIDRVTVNLPSTSVDTVPDVSTGLETLDPDNPDPNTFKNWILAVFNLEHLFDWLPEQYSNQFDAVISFIGSSIVVMLIYSIIKIFF